MPIRMTDDGPDDQEESGSGGGGRRSSGGGGGGGGGGGVSPWVIFSLLSFLWRNPKLAAVVILIGGTYYMCSGRGKHAGPPPPDRDSPRSEQRLGRGSVLDQKVYDEALVHEPLAESALPSRVSLLEYAPPRGNQGRQGSCVGWATSYAARTILYARQTGRPPGDNVFSPSFTYNQIGRDDCNGAYLIRALELLQQTGDLPLSRFAYDQRSCSHRPDANEKEDAAQYRIAGFTRLSVDASDYRTNALALKQHLAQGAPVVIGMNVGGTFESAMRGSRIWHPTRSDYDMRGDWGGHAMSVIGYDDTLEGGAFQLMNSWGPDWGEDGVAFVRYPDFDRFVKEAFGLYPMGDARAQQRTEQRIEFGLIDNATKRRIPLQAVNGITFRTAKPIRKGTRFKVEFGNAEPVYTYLFGQETDGTSYVLFPYSEKHSPYCGTTGTRLFPRKQSLTADEQGTRDAVAVVISPKALDYKALNARITAAPGAGYADKLTRALGDSVNVKTRARAVSDLVELTAPAGETAKVHALVLEFDKI